MSLNAAHDLLVYFTIRSKEDIRAKAKEPAISTGLKYLFLIHGIFSLLFGLLFCFTPLCFADLFKHFGSVNQCTMRLTGAIILALAVKD
jgi:hypothetical protein